MEDAITDHGGTPALLEAGSAVGPTKESMEALTGQPTALLSRDPL